MAQDIELFVSSPKMRNQERSIIIEAIYEINQLSEFESSYNLTAYPSTSVVKNDEVDISLNLVLPDKCHIFICFMDTDAGDKASTHETKLALKSSRETGLPKLLLYKYPVSGEKSNVNINIETADTLSGLTEFLSIVTDSKELRDVLKRDLIAALPTLALRVVPFRLPPPFEWCVIPDGDTTVIDTTFYPAKMISQNISSFRVSKYPVTNGQYQVFVDALDGYRNTEWWDFSSDAQKWREGHNISNDTAFTGDSLPRTNMNWFDAVAFCRWLSRRLGYSVSLPTEWQWQKAAEGKNSTLYPWGNEFDPLRCNCGNRFRQPTPVDKFEQGASENGVVDLVGNIWEWCLNIWENGDTSLLGNDMRILRGGSWTEDNPEELKVTVRYSAAPFSLSNERGFRIVTSV